MSPRFAVLAVLGLALLGSGCALGQTDPATDVTDVSATFNGRLSSTENAGNEYSPDHLVEYWFKYGTTQDYGTETPHRTIEMPEHEFEQEFPVSEPAAGLSPDTTYHYQLCADDAQEGVGPGCTGDATFTTHPTLYVAMGDSVATTGDPVRYPERFFSYLNLNGAANNLENIAVGGATSGDLRGDQLTTGRALIDDPATDTTVVTVDIGGNDILHQPSCYPPGPSFNLTSCQPTLAQFSTNFTFILDSLNDSLAGDPGSEQLIVMAYYNPWSGDGPPSADNNAQLVLLGTDRALDCDGSGEQIGLNDRIACIGSEHQARLADAYPPFVGHGAIGDYFFDDIHPNGAGHQAIADIFQAAFEAP
jgi:lysophospholipase L1-like esterase